MTTESDRSFRAFLESEPSLIRAPSYDATAEVSWHAGVAWARERETRRLIAGAKDGSIASFVNLGHDLPDTRDFDCPHCGGSGHKDDVRGETWLPIATAPKDGTPVLCFTPDNDFSAITGIDVLWWDDDDWLYAGSSVAFQPTHWIPLPVAPLSPTAVDDKETADIGSNDPRQSLGSSARYGDPHIEAGQPETVVGQGNESESLPITGQSEPPADLVERARLALLDEKNFDKSDAEMCAAFASEYTAGIVRDTASRFADDVTFWKGRALAFKAELSDLRQAIEVKVGTEHASTEDAYLAACTTIVRQRDRAESLTDELADKNRSYDRVVESRRHWRERAESAENKIKNAAQAMAETHKSWESRCHAIVSALGRDLGGDPEMQDASSAVALAVSKEREACANVAEKFTPADHIAHDMRVGSFPRQSHAGAAIAAAIRTRKGVSDVA